MKSRLRFALALCLACGAASAQAPEPNATLTEITGKVLVNAGKEFLPAQANQRLKPGDRVMVMDKSEATIVFDDECRREVEANKLVTVPDRSTCAGGYLAEQGVTPGDASAIGGSAAGNGQALLPIALGAIVVGVVLDEDDASP